MENTPESAWLAGESLFEASRGDSNKNKIENEMLQIISTVQKHKGQRRLVKTVPGPV